MLRLAILLFTAITVVIPAQAAPHVVVLVWDGLRPDSVKPETTPTLHRLATEGVFFQNHHSVFVSVTVANGTALASGCYPAHNGTCANNEYRPAINPQATVSTASPEVAGHLPVPTLAELLQQAGHRTAIAGSKSVALVHDARPEPPNITILEGRGLPETSFQPLRERLGPAPADSLGRDDWTTRALIGPVWESGLPTFSLLWLAEPDYTQHMTGLGSADSLKAHANSDRNLARVLAELDARGVRQQTDVLVVSDHGFSTVQRVGDVAGALSQAGFKATRRLAAAPQPGEIVVVGNSGATLLYVTGQDEALIQRVVEFLQHQDFVGVIFTRRPFAGTFTLDQVRLDTPHAPDIVLGMRWTDETNGVGVVGGITPDGSPGVGQGTHGSLSRYDLRATLIAAGPSFRRGMINELPSGNPDVAPTVLEILGLPVPAHMDGRVLVEALRAGTLTNLPPLQVRTLQAGRQLPDGGWQQYLRVTRFGEALYFDEGNGAFVAKPAPPALPTQP